MPLLFSYGTLQQEAVQLSTFGRRLEGHADELVGFAQSTLRIQDSRFVAQSGTSDHAIVTFDGREDSRVRGTVLEVSDAELASADAYEPASYRRISAVLASGKMAWVYADERSLSVRPALVSDADAIAALTVQLGYDVPAPAISNRLSRILAKSDHEVLVADAAGRPVGLIHLEIAEHFDTDPVAAIGGLVVDESYRGKGIGRVLMAHAEAWARQRGCSIVRLRSSSTRTAAHRFYERLGYRNIKTQYSFAKSLDSSAPDELKRLVPRVSETR